MKTRLSLVLAFLVALAVSPAAQAALTDGYAACNTSDDIIPFDLATHAPGTPIPLPYTYPYPYDLTMNPDGTEVWAVDGSGDHVVVIDMLTNTISTVIDVGEYPNSVVFTDDGSLALVSARDGDYVKLIDTSTYTVVDSLDVTTASGGIYDGPGQMALDPKSTRIYAVDWYADTLYEIAPDGSSVLRTADIGIKLWQLVVDPGGEYIYITDRNIASVYVVAQSTLTVVETVVVGLDPWGIDVTLDGSKLVVACEDDATVHIIDTADWSTVVIPLPVGAGPIDVDILDVDNYAFIAGGEVTGTDAVYVVDLTTNTLKQPIELGGDPSCVAVQAQTTSDDVGVGGEELVAPLKLACHPNPFGPASTVRYSVPEHAEVELSVYDVSGRRVAILESGPRTPGDHAVTWSGTDESGGLVSAGVYFVRLEALGASRTVKAVLLR